jgi:large conductance mechanosensitive channel
MGKCPTQLIGLVIDVITPLLGAIFGVPGEAFKTLTLGSVNLGLFINAVLNFLIIAFSLYLFIKWVAGFNRQEAVAEPPGPDIGRGQFEVD